MKPAHIIVFGNEKGGTGKSTLAMHVVVCLLRKGRSVGVIDLDARQQSFARFVENRARQATRAGCDLPIPACQSVAPSEATDRSQADREDQQALERALSSLGGSVEFVVIDCPGSHTVLSRLAHALADTLVTPMNDSFIDLDLLGQVDPTGFQVERLSHYAEMVWDSRKYRSAGERPPMDWVVTRNRLATLDSINNRRVHAALDALQKRILFRYVPGLNERVIYRELFPLGLTMMDLDALPNFGKLSLSQVTARQEVRQLVASLNLPD